MSYWLVKQEPESYSFEDFLRDKNTIWDGVRNYQARNFLKEMKKGDEVLYYHSGKQKEVVGISEVVKEHFPDTISEDNRWVAVELKATKKLKKAVTLGQIKASKELENIALVRQSRLSVVPLTKDEFHFILDLSE